MIITDLTVTLFNWPIKPWKTGRSRFGGDVKLGIVTIHTDEDVEGYSFLGSPSQGADVFAGPLIDVLKPRLLGRNPLDIGAIWQEMWNMHRLVSLRAIGAVDVALWDLAGKAAGFPIHRMLGTCKEKVPAYASSAWLPNSEAYAEEAIRFQSLGWTAYKVHPHGIPKKDVEICRALREAVGDDMVLMLDAMWAYSYEEAVRVGRAIEKLDFFWYEDPLAEEDIYNYVY